MAISKPSPFLRSSLSLGSSSDLHPVRRASDFEINYPPRYSTLIGTSADRSNALATLDDDDVLPPEPPAYSTAFHRTNSLEPPDPSPSSLSSPHVRSQSLSPTPHSRNGIHTYHYHINGSKAEPWAALKVYSPSNLDRENSPHFRNGDLIRGAVELNLDTPQNINSISLSLRGRIISSSSYTFLEQPITSWDRNDGDPRSMFFTPETIIKKFEGKLSGQYTWPFSLAFPEEVTIRGQHQYLSKTYPTPRSFIENESNTSLQYDLVLRITHGMLRADSKLNVQVAYVPDTTPDPFSLLCEAAYRRNTSTPGPDEDPDGWFTLSHANIHGKLSSNGRHVSNDRQAHLRCTLSLARSQCYSRGSVIPCHLSIHSKNTEALDSLANHECIRICLVRRIHLHEDPKQAHSRTQQVQNANGNKVPAGIIEQIKTIERAVWWPANSEEPDTRYLQGEIHLSKALQPSSQFLLFKVLYTIELYPFESRVFKCTNSGFSTDNLMRNPKAFMTHSVTIVSKHREGQVPVPATILKPDSRKGVEFPPPDFSFCAV